MLGGVLGLRGPVSSFLEPGFPAVDGALDVFVAMTLGGAILFSTGYGSVLVAERVRTGSWGRLQAVPAGLAVAGVMVAASRLLAFVPGYMYGATMRPVPPEEVDDDRRGRLVALAYGMLLAAALCAFVARGALAPALADPDHSRLVGIVDLILVMMVVAATEFTTFSLLPIADLDGPRVRQWNPRVWWGLWLVGLTSFLHVVLTPQFGFWREGSAALVATLFVSFAVLSFAFWGWFRIPRTSTTPCGRA